MQTPNQLPTNLPNRRSAWKLLLGTGFIAVAAVATAVAPPAFAHGGMGMRGGPMGDMGGGMGGGHGMSMMGGRHGERMLDSVGATAEQKTQLRQIMDTARSELKPLHEAGRALRRELQGLFVQPNVDANAVEAVRQKLQANHEQASKRMSQAMIDASRVLTPEQRKQMADRMSQRRGMMERHRAERQSLERGAAPAPR